MADGGRHRHVVELLPRVRAAQQEPAAAHVAAAHEGGGEQEALAEDLQQHVHVFPAGDAAQEDDLALRPGRGVDEPRVAQERTPVARLVGVDGDRRPAPQAIEVDRRLRRDEAFAGRDDHDAGHARRRPRERARVAELAAEVEAAQEREHLAQRAPLRRAQGAGERELRLRVEHEPRALAGGGGGGEEEDARRDRRGAHALAHGRTACRNSSTPRVLSTSSLGEPAPPRHVHAPAHVPERVHGVGVGGDDEADAALARLAHPARLHVQAVRIAVDLDGRPRLRHRVEDLLHVHGERRAGQHVAAEGVAPDLELGPAHGGHDAPRHLVGVHLVAVVHAGHDHVELLEDGVGVVERPVGQDVRFRAAQQPHLHLLLGPRDVLPLPLQAVEGQPARVVRGGGVVGDGHVLHAHRVRAPRHLLDAVLAVRVVRVAVDQALATSSRRTRRAGRAPVSAASTSPSSSRSSGSMNGRPRCAVEVRLFLDGQPAPGPGHAALVEREVLESASAASLARWASEPVRRCQATANARPPTACTSTLSPSGRRISTRVLVLLEDGAAAAG